MWYAYFTGMITSKFTIASKNDSNFDPSTIGIGRTDAFSPASIATAPLAGSDTETLGIASNCCNNWYSVPVSIKYLTMHRMMNNALNVCHICILLRGRI